MNGFLADGFNLQKGPSTDPTYTGWYETNQSGQTYVAWNWKAGGATTATNSAGAGNVPTAGSVKIDGADSTTALAGTIAATSISANTGAGFSIVTWTGNGSDATVDTGLEKEAELVIVKGRANLPLYSQWVTYHKDLQDDYVIYLNLTNAEADGLGNYWRKNAFTDNVFGVGDDIYGPNVNGTTMVGYCFHSVDGYSKIGSYVGTGASGNTIVTGFRPAYDNGIKRTDRLQDWKLVYDR